MDIIMHRRNTGEELSRTPKYLGVEVDIRSNGSELIVHHDPFVEGELFEIWLNKFNHGTLILNVKEEGLEDSVLQTMGERGIDNFFFLDQSLPFLIKTAKKGERRCAVRVSEFESIITALSLSGLIDWVWVDCFSHFPLSQLDFVRLQEANFKLCLVSPELQGRTDPTEIDDIKKFLRLNKFEFDAVCTKVPELWS